MWKSVPAGCYVIYLNLLGLRGAFLHAVGLTVVSLKSILMSGNLQLRSYRHSFTLENFHV